MATGLDEWTVDPLHGPQVRCFTIESFQQVRAFHEAEAMVERWRAMGPYLGQHAENLRRGLSAGQVAAQDAVQKVSETLAASDESWALLHPLRVAHADWTPA